MGVGRAHRFRSSRLRGGLRRVCRLPIDQLIISSWKIAYCANVQPEEWLTELAYGRDIFLVRVRGGGIGGDCAARKGLGEIGSERKCSSWSMGFAPHCRGYVVCMKGKKFSGKCGGEMW